jgi:hypothetical protein
MGAVLFAAILSTLHLEGDVAPAGGDYVVVPFAVPAGTVEFDVVRTVPTANAILDFGIWSPGGFRGWAGGLTDPATVGVADSSRGYLPGPIATGDWQLVIGKAKLNDASAHYSADITFRDAATLTPRTRAPFAPAVVESGARWYKGDLHVHDSESGDARASLDEIVALARARGLDFIVLSDHNTVSQQALSAALQATLPDLLLVRGIEVTTYGGHGGALGASAYVDHRIGLDGRGATQMVHDVNAQGGVFVVNHAVLDLGMACIGCAWKYDDAWSEVGAMEIQTGNYRQWKSLFFGTTLTLWDKQLDRGLRIAAVGGSDDHRAGMDTGGAPSQIGTPTTLVWADELSEAAIVAAVRAGRTAVALRGPDDPLVELATTGATPQRIGDTATGAAVEVEAHVLGGSGLELSLVQDGAEKQHVTVDAADWRHRFTVAVPMAGSRVRLQLADGVDPIVVTSHLWLAYAPPTGGCEIAGRGSAGALALALLALLAVALRRARRWRRLHGH